MLCGMTSILSSRIYQPYWLNPAKTHLKGQKVFIWLLADIHHFQYKGLIIFSRHGRVTHGSVMAGFSLNFMQNLRYLHVDNLALLLWNVSDNQRSIHLHK